MVSKRKPINSQNAKLNYRPNEMKTEPKGTKPTTDPSSIKEIMMIMVLYVCKKALFYNTIHRIAVYLGVLFLLSLISDFTTIPKTLFSRSDNIFNLYFVKYAWGWNLLFLTPYVILTSFIYCCGQKDKMIKQHIIRIFIATFFWWLWTTAFNYIETGYGKCDIINKQFNTKQSCLKAGNTWNGFDISGHSFILIYGSLLLIEEARSIVNWDGIKDNLRLEEHYRATNDTNYNTNPLKALTKEQFVVLQINYEKYTPYIRLLFVGITFLTILWDFMLLWTICYYHIMIEKLLGGLIAVLTWFITYKLWYPSNYLPRMPGDGIFKYIKAKAVPPVPLNAKRRTGSINGSQPTFMGRVLNVNRNEANASIAEDMVR